MKIDRLRDMLEGAVAFDVETHSIQPGLLAPPLVCGSVAAWEGGRAVGELLDADGARAAFRALLRSDRTIVGANIAFDMLVMALDAARAGEDLMPEIFAAYERGRVYDLQVAEALHAIASGFLGRDPRTSSDPRTASPTRDPETGKMGRYSLAICVDLVLGRRDAKANDRFRQSYALLEGTPIPEWPPEARTYPVDDAVNTLEVALAQAGLVPRPAPHAWPDSGPQRCLHCGIAIRFSDLPPCAPRAWASENLHDLSCQCYAAFAMHLGAAWGFRVDPDAVAALESRVTEARERDQQGFLDAGLLKYKREPNQSLSPTEITVVRAVVASSVAEASRKTGLDEASVRATVEALAARGALTTGKATSAIKRRAASAYGCTDPCRACAGTGKVPSTKSKNLIGCKECAATGLDLEGSPVPRTEGSTTVDAATGEESVDQGVGIGRDSLNESGDELLIDFASYLEDAKILETYVPFLRKGVDDLGRPRPITLRPNVIVETGRASYGDVVHQLPRAGGVRECVVSRPGTVLCSCDYGGLELVTHAQSCLWIVGHSRLARALNDGTKVHDALGAQMTGARYDEFVARVKSGDKHAKNVRQAAKPANFGFPGGMGAVKLVLQQRKQGPDTTGPDGRKYKGLRFCVLIGGARACGENDDGSSCKVVLWPPGPRARQITPTCRRCIECAEDIRRQWLTAWPENAEYFKFVTDAYKNGQDLGGGRRLLPGQVQQHGSLRLRGALDFNNCANGFFQGLAGDGAKLALTRVSREQYDRTVRLADGSPSPLYGTRTILFAHDELVVEMRADVASDAADRLQKVMVEAMRSTCPDVACEAPPALMRRWYKGSDEVRHRGVLVPWEPGHDASTCGECRA